MRFQKLDCIASRSYRWPNAIVWQFVAQLADQSTHSKLLAVFAAQRFRL